MSDRKPIAHEKKLIVMARVEPGSLGPDGVDHIEGFCRYANQNISTSAQRYTRWHIIPRYDKTLPEIEYFIAHKKLNNFQVVKYLQYFNNEQDSFEEELYCQLTSLIEHYLSTSEQS